MVISSSDIVQADQATHSPWDRCSLWRPWGWHEVLGKDPPGNGIDGMHILFGWQALKYMVTGKKFDEIPGLTLLDPSLCCPLALPADKQHHDPELLDKLKKLLVHKMSKDEGTFLVPLAAGGHWSLLVINKNKKQIRYYDSLAGSDEKADIGLVHEIANMPEKCLAMAENLLGIMLDLGCIKGELLHRPGLMKIRNADSLGAPTSVVNLYWPTLRKRWGIIS